MGELNDFVVTYESKDELQRQVDYYLKYPNERYEKAKKGMRLIQKKHTFEQRAKVFSRVIQVLIKNKYNEKQQVKDGKITQAYN